MTKNNNDLQTYFEKNKKNLIHKWLHYFPVYEQHFNRFKGKNVTILEFGVSHGGSLQMWRDYFGSKARIIGVDINPECKKFEDKQTEIYIGSQEDRDFLKKLMKKVGNPDIIIDDGGHTMLQQITTFEETYHLLEVDGVYLVEDLHTSYWKEFGGGLRKQGTFIEYAKDLIDQLYAWHSRDSGSLEIDDYTKTTTSMHFYDSIIVFEKKLVAPPTHKQTGNKTLSELEKWDYRSAS